MRRRIAVLVALALAAGGPLAAQRAAVRRAPRAAAGGCAAVPPTRWGAIRDPRWPQLTHRDGDSAWAHLEPDGLPGPSRSWCNPLESKAAVAAGRSLYTQHCAMCHGDAGKGDGPGAGMQLPAPFDFTAPAFAGMRVPPGPGVLYAILARGIAGTGMRAFPELGPWERLALLAYVTRLPGDSAVAGAKEWADTLNARRPR